VASVPDVATDRSVMAMTSLVCGITAWVPLVILAAAPISLVCALLAHLAVQGPDRHRRLAPARWGVVLTLVAMAIHSAVFMIAVGLGWLTG
jgi:hypothetical protein